MFSPPVQYDIFSADGVGAYLMARGLQKFSSFAMLTFSAYFVTKCLKSEKNNLLALIKCWSFDVISSTLRLRSKNANVRSLASSGSKQLSVLISPLAKCESSSSVRPAVRPYVRTEKGGSEGVVVPLLLTENRRRVGRRDSKQEGGGIFLSECVCERVSHVMEHVNDKNCFLLVGVRLMLRVLLLSRLLPAQTDMSR